MSGRLFWAALILAGCLLPACSRPDASPPRGLAGLAFGDPPGRDLTPAPAGLPSGLAGILAYYTRPGPTAPFRGVALTDPVFAFARGRLFSVAAALADPAEAPRLRRELEAGFGPPLCRDRKGSVSCLWRLAEVDVALESGGQAPVRLLVRHRALAGEVLSWRDQEVPLEDGGEP
jgi:hypothetical protein